MSSLVPHYHSGLNEWYPKFVYRGCESSVACLEVVRLEFKPGLYFHFLWAGEQDGTISIYNLFSQHLSLKFKATPELSNKPEASGDVVDAVLSITDLEGGYIMTYSRSFGILIWYWAFAGSKLPSNMKETAEGCFALNPTLLIPPTPRLVASYLIDSVTFCCPGVLMAPPDLADDLNFEKSRNRVKFIAAPYCDRNLVQIVSLLLPSLHRTDSKSEKADDVNVPNFNQVIVFRIASERNMMMTIKFCLIPKLSSMATLATSLLFGFEDGTVQWHTLYLDDPLHLVKARTQLVWELCKLHDEPVLEVQFSEDFSSGFSVGADGKLANFYLNQSELELGQPKQYTIGDPTEPHLPILCPPSVASDTLHLFQMNSGGSCIAVKNGVISVGHFDHSIGLYSAKDLQLIRKLNFHRSGIDDVLYFDASECSARSFGTLASPLLFAASQDSRISLWQIFG